MQKRADSWNVAIAEEERYVMLISYIIEAEIDFAISNLNLSIDGTTLHTAERHVNVRRQAAHAYHVLYRGVLDEVVIEHSEDTALNGTLGVVTQFVRCNRQKPGVFIVRLGTRCAPFPSRFCGIKHRIHPMHLQQQRFHSSSSSQNPSSHPIVIMYFDAKHEPYHISFMLQKWLVDIISNSLPDGELPRSSFIQPFILSVKKDHQRIDKGSNSSVNEGRWQYLLKGEIFFYKPTMKSKCTNRKETNRRPILFQCPCHQNITCPYRNMCGLCSDEPSEHTNTDIELTSKHKNDHEFDLDFLLKPDARVIQLPFLTERSIVPSAALYLNELNLVPVNQKIIPEELFMSRLIMCAPGTITNKDILSLYPHNNISGSVFNLMTGW